MGAPLFCRGVARWRPGVVKRRPYIGNGYVVMAWLIAIALWLIVWGRCPDIAVRDLVMAMTGAWMLARLTPFAAGSLEPTHRGIE